MEDKETTSVHVLKLIIVAIMCVVVLVMVFAVGVFVGQKRAEFSFHWAEDYHRNFGGPQQGIFGNFPNQGFMNGHGIFGTVIKIDGNNIIIKGQDNMEETAIVSSTTTIVNSTKKITVSDIKVDDTIIIIGSPNSQGQIEAKFIRILPPRGLTSMYMLDAYPINCGSAVIIPSVTLFNQLQI